MKRTGIRRPSKSGKTVSAEALPLRTLPRGGRLRPKTQLQRRKLVAALRSKGHKHQKAALDKLCRAIVFARDPACCRCGKKEQGQWCHVSSRRYVSLRWRLENSLRLCAGCHLWWHHRPLEAVTWFWATYPDRSKKLQLTERAPRKVDLKLERLYLEAEAAKWGIAS